MWTPRWNVWTVLDRFWAVFDNFRIVFDRFRVVLHGFRTVFFRFFASWRHGGAAAPSRRRHGRMAPPQRQPRSPPAPVSGSAEMVDCPGGVASFDAPGSFDHPLVLTIPPVAKKIGKNFCAKFFQSFLAMRAPPCTKQKIGDIEISLLSNFQLGATLGAQKN